MDYLQSLSKVVTNLYNFIFVSFVVLFTLLMQTQKANAQAYEVACRAKAKEIAAETYSSCVTESKQAQLQKIRTEYQQKLNGLKSYYDGELKKLKNGGTVNNSATPTVQPTKSNNANTKIKTRKSGARSAALPEKTVPTQRGMIQSAPINTNEANSFTDSSVTLDDVAPPPAMSRSIQDNEDSHPYGEEADLIEMPVEN